HELQERRLAAPRLPDDEDEFPGVNLEVEALERDHVLAVAKADVVELQHPRRAAEILAPHTLSCRQAPPRGEYRNSGARRATIEHRAATLADPSGVRHGDCRAGRGPRLEPGRGGLDGGASLRLAWPRRPRLYARMSEPLRLPHRAARARWGRD